MSGKAAFGTQLLLGGTAGTAVARITNIEGPESSTEMIDVTAHDSSGNFREEIPTFLEAGEVTLTLNFDPNNTTHKNGAGGLRKLWQDRTLSSWAIAWPVTPAAFDTFSAYVTKFGVSAPFDGKLEGKVTLKISGALTAA